MCSSSAAPKPTAILRRWKTSTLLTVVLDGHDTRPRCRRGDRRFAPVRGTAEQVAEQIKTNVLDVGVDGVIVNLPTHGYTPGVITKVGRGAKGRSSQPEADTR